MKHGALRERMPDQESIRDGAADRSSRPSRPGAEAEAELEVRDLAPRDVESLCHLLASSFEREYADQGLDVWSFRRHYQLVAWANLLLKPLHLDFFQVAVALLEGEVVGTVASFRAGPRAWYQGFGAVNPEIRRRGVYRRVIRHSLERVAARGGEVGGGEIRIDNQGALRPYRDLYGCEVLPAQSIYMVPVAELPASPVAAPATPDASGSPLRRIGQRRFDRLPEAPLLRELFRGGFLIEKEVERSFPKAVLRWWLPPLTARSWAVFRPAPEGERLAFFVRVRTHWPARIRALDALYLDSELSPGEGRELARRALLTVLAGLRGKTAMPVRIYVRQQDAALRELCAELGFSHLADLHSIRTEVAPALARTDRFGHLRRSGAR